MRGANERLPEPTRDHVQLKRDVDEFGYCVYAEALDDEFLARLRERLLDQAKAELETGLAFEDGATYSARGEPLTAPVNQRLWMLINKGAAFRDVAVHPETSEIVAHILGREYQLSTLSANIAKPGGAAMQLHTDQWWMPPPSAPELDPVRPGNITRATAGSGNQETLQIAPPAACNVMYMLNDFTADNGGTRLVPRSHLTGQQPNRASGLREIAAEGPAGTAVIFEGRTWHGTGANTSDRVRLGLLATFCGPQFRTQENYTLGILPEVFDDCSDELKKRIGFGIWSAYGRVGNPSFEIADPAQERIGELHPSVDAPDLQL